MRIGIAATLKADREDASRPDDWQEEFDSPQTLADIAAAIEANGHRACQLGDGPALVESLLHDPPELVFNIAEGHGVGRSREARVPAVCELLGIPYTGSDPLACAVSLDKDAARRLVASAGVAVPVGFVAQPGATFDMEAVPYPAIVKPAWEGSSKGIRGQCVVRSASELRDALDRVARDYQQPLLVEELIAGDEITVGVLGNDPPDVLGVMRVNPRQPTREFVYSLEVKRDWRNRVSYEVSPPFPPEVSASLRSAALAAYRALGCRDVARVDFRLRDGIPYFLEVNPLPGLNPETGDLVLLARGVGVSHETLIGRIIDAAVKRRH